MSRRSAREDAFKIIDGKLVTGEAGATEEELFQQHTEEEIQYILNVVDAVDGDFAFLRAAVERFSKGFAFDRIYKVDCAIILLAAAEILFTDVPDKAAVNEAVEIAKIYSTDRSAAFINGVLASFMANKEELLAERETFGKDENDGGDESNGEDN